MEDNFSELSWFRRELVSAARVMVIGCGALGNEVLKQLAMFGVGKIVVVDFDRVENGNLCRSVLFSKEDASLGRLKVDAAADGIRRINEEVLVEKIVGDAAYDVGLGLIAEMDVIICCVDSRWARYCINRNCMRVGVPWVDGGIGQLDGTARVFVPGRNCYACGLGEHGLAELRRRMPCPGIIKRNEAAGRVATTPISSSIIAAVQVQEALKLLHRKEMTDGELTSLCGKMFYYEGQHLSGRLLSFEAWDEDCPCHERWLAKARLPLTVDNTVEDCLDMVKSMLPEDDNPALLLRDDCFVDYVQEKSTGENSRIMAAGRYVEGIIEKNSYLSTLRRFELYQNEWRELDAGFPYKHLSLKELGIPPRDIIQFETSAGRLFFEID